MSSMLLLMQLLLAACCYYVNVAHAQQQVSSSVGNQLSITVKARKINFSSSTSNENIANSLNLANSRRNEPSKQQNRDNRTKIITTTSEAEAKRRNYRKSRIIVREIFNDLPLKLPTGFRPISKPRQQTQQRLFGIPTKTTMSNEGWTPIAYGPANFGTVGSKEPEMSTTKRSPIRYLTKALKEPMLETIIYGAQRPVEQHFLGQQNAELYEQHLFQARNAKADNKTSENSGALANFGQQHKINERDKQRKGTAAQEKLRRQNQATDDNRKNTTNKPVENITLNNMQENKQKKPVKNTAMANMSNSSIVTMKISSRRAIKNTTKLNNSSSSSSASSTAGHSNLIMMSTHQLPFKSNETTWPLSDKNFEASLTDNALKTSSSTTELPTSVSTSSKLSNVASSSTSPLSVKSSTSSSTASATSKISSFVLASIVNASTTITSNNLTTAEPKICVPMLVRENSTVNPDEFIELERIVCFPLPPDSNLNFNGLTEESVEVINLAVKDKNLHEDYWNSKMNSRSNGFHKNIVLLYLIMLCWYL